MAFAGPAAMAATRLAVFELSDDTPPTRLGAAVSETLIDALNRLPDVQLLERVQLHRIQRELDFGSSPLTSPHKAESVARHWKSDYALVGSINKAAGVYRVRIALISMKAERRVFEIRESSSDILQLQYSLHRKVVDFLGMTHRYDLAPGKHVISTKSNDAFIRYGRGLYSANRGLLEQAEKELKEALAIDSAFKQASGLLEKVRRALVKKHEQHMTGVHAWHSVWFIGPVTALLAGPTESYADVSTRSLYYALLTGLLSGVFLSNVDDEEDGDESLAWGIGTGVFSGAFLYNAFRARQMENDRNRVLASLGQYDPFIEDSWALMLTFFSAPTAQEKVTDLAARLGFEDDDLGTGLGFASLFLSSPTAAWEWGIHVNSTDNDSVVWGEVYVRRTWSATRHRKDRFSPYFSASGGFSTLQLSNGYDESTYALGAGVGTRYFLRSDVVFDCGVEYKFIPFDNVAGEWDEIEEDTLDFGGIYAGIRVSVVLDR